MQNSHLNNFTAPAKMPLACLACALQVLYEDEDLVAVNKPPGVITAPKHRYVGGSIVNRIIGLPAGPGAGSQRARWQISEARVLELRATRFRLPREGKMHLSKSCLWPLALAALLQARWGLSRWCCTAWI